MATLAHVLPASQLEPKFEPLSFALGEIPRGTLTEIAGPASSGRTTFLHALLEGATARSQEFCALVDVENAFDPVSAAAFGVRLTQVLWIRCGGNIEYAFKAVDLLAQAGGFGLVVLDLADTPAAVARRAPMAGWYRLRHGVEKTRTALVSISRQINAHSCSALKIELARDRVLWRGRLLTGVEIEAERIQNHRVEKKSFKFLV